MITTAPSTTALHLEIRADLARRLVVIVCAVVAAVVLVVSVGTGSSSRPATPDDRPSPPASVEILAGLDG